eukprot:COSAG06_NODE_63634_length_261_cov_7.734568_1_plen_82_part_10
MARKCARTFSIVVEKGKKSILDVGHLLPGGIARSVRRDSKRVRVQKPATDGSDWNNPKGPQFATRQKVIDTLAQWDGQLIEP